MLRILISGCAVVVLLLSMFLLPPSVSARRCGFKEPETLLSLYRSSDAIYVGAFDRAADEAIVDQNEDYTIVEIAKYFTIVSTLKGESRKFLVLKDREYRYTSVGGDEDDEEMEDPDEEEIQLKNGDPVLLFVDLDDEEEGPSLTDYRDGLKKLGTREMGVYEARIRELHSIFSAKKVDQMQIVEWLIRCAEDPATLWEGTYELLSGYESAEWAERYAASLKERIAAGEEVEEATTADIDEDEAEGDEGPNTLFRSEYPKLLNDQHKQRLANILFETRVAPDAAPEAAQEDEARSRDREFVRGERELIQLVKRWGDTRLIPFLLDRLRTGNENPWFTSQTMEMVAELLESEEAEEAAERYSDIVSGDDDEAISSDDDEDEAEAEDADETVEDDAEAERPTGQDGDVETAPEADVSEDEAPVKKVTYKELRAELLAKFLEICERVINERAEGGEGARP